MLYVTSVFMLSGSAVAQENRVKSANPVLKPRVTFIELGSKSCVPCRLMQPVIQSVESRFSPQLKVIFYDVWTDNHRRYAEQYGIRIIPTQVFLDEKGREFFRHEGFFPEAEIVKLLNGHGLTSLKNEPR